MAGLARTSLALLAVFAVLNMRGEMAAARNGGGSAPAARKVQLFNIPAQSLASALQAYSAVTGNQVLCDSRLAAGHRSNPVIGLFTPETALRLLLDGTELTIRYTGPQDITLTAPGAETEFGQADPTGDGRQPQVMILDTLHVDVPAGAKDRPDFSAYGRTVRLAVRDALARDPETANRIYDLQIDIWIARNGRVRDPHLLLSTGSLRLDAAIRRVIGSAVVNETPPPDIPQPIRIAVVAI